MPKKGKGKGGKAGKGATVAEDATETPLETSLEIPVEGKPVEAEKEKEKEKETDKEKKETEKEKEEEPKALDRSKSTVKKAEELMNSISDAKSRAIELVFAFDTTGSMYSYLDEVRKKVKEICGRLLSDIPGIRIGIMAIGDYCDQNSTYVVDFLDLSSDVKQITQYVNNVAKTGGGDAPEAYEYALRLAKDLSWSKSLDVNKALVVIGDAAPHPPSYTDLDIFWRDDVAELVKMGVKIYGVQPAGTGAGGEKLFYEELGETSGGVYLNLNKLELITDMFLAVCYREFSNEHLETFRQEVVKEGRMNAEMTEMFTQLARHNSDLSSDSVKKATKLDKCTEAWYQRKFDKGSPTYYYNSATKKFSTSKSASSTTTTTTKAAPKGKGGKKRKADEITKSDDKEEKKDDAEKDKKEEKEDEGKAKKGAKKGGKKATGKRKADDDKEEPEKEKEKDDKDDKEDKDKEEKKEKKAKPAKKAAAKPKGKKAKKDDEKKEGEEAEEEDLKPVKKFESVVLGTGLWKKDRSGRLVKLDKEK